MQGSVCKGYDGGPVSAEYNVKANVAAAQTVLSAPWKQITITPLDTCGLVTLSGERFQRLVKSEDPLVKALPENYRIWARRSKSASCTPAACCSTPWPSIWPIPITTLLKLETLPITVTDDGFTKVDPQGRKMSVATALEESRRLP